MVNYYCFSFTCYLIFPKNAKNFNFQRVVSALVWFTSVRISAGTPVAIKIVQSCCNKPHWNIAFWQLLVAPGGLVGDTRTRTSWERKIKQNLPFKDLKVLRQIWPTWTRKLMSRISSLAQPDLGALSFIISWHYLCYSTYYIMLFT